MVERPALATPHWPIERWFVSMNTARKGCFDVLKKRHVSADTRIAQQAKDRLRRSIRMKMQSRFSRSFVVGTLAGGV
ncbi:MAG: hypothetical protein VB878_11975, partial [Pirellulaceae bacterium]